MLCKIKNETHIYVLQFIRTELKETFCLLFNRRFYNWHRQLDLRFLATFATYHNVQYHFLKAFLSVFKHPYLCGRFSKEQFINRYA